MSDLDHPILDRAEERIERARRGLVGAASRRTGRKPLAVSVADHNAARIRHADELAGNTRKGLAGQRDLRYPSGPWAGSAGDLLPVSWFLLWRSKINWTPSAAMAERISKGRVWIEHLGAPERPAVNARPKPIEQGLKPARLRLRPRDAVSLRAVPKTEE